MYGSSQQSLNNFSRIEMESENKLYPNLASAPDPVVFRLEKLKDIETEVKQAILSRRHTYKKYAKANSVFKSIQATCAGLSLSSTAGSIATGITVVGLPFTVILGSVAAFTGFISLVSTPVLRYTETKKKKHDRLGQMLKIFLITLDKKISKFTSDGNLSDEEFSEIMDLYIKVKQEINVAKYKATEADTSKLKTKLDQLQSDLNKLK